MTALMAYYDISLFEKISPPFGCVACKTGIATGIQANLASTSCFKMRHGVITACAFQGKCNHPMSAVVTPDSFKNVYKIKFKRKNNTSLNNAMFRLCFLEESY